MKNHHFPMVFQTNVGPNQPLQQLPHAELLNLSTTAEILVEGKPEAVEPGGNPSGGFQKWMENPKMVGLFHGQSHL